MLCCNVQRVQDCARDALTQLLSFCCLFCPALQHVQWVFIGEGMPSVLLGLCLPWLLHDGPHAGDGSVTRWLAPHEVQLLQADVSRYSSIAGIAQLAVCFKCHGWAI
jgi:hypothetical protein